MGRDGEEIRYRLGPHSRRLNRRAQRVAAVPVPLARITRLMALAIKLDDPGAASQAELARLGHVSRSRMSQILNLRRLAPDIQERLLFLEPVSKGREPIHERALRPVTRLVDWTEQRRAMEAVARAADRPFDSRLSGQTCRPVAHSGDGSRALRRESGS